MSFIVGQKGVHYYDDCGLDCEQCGAFIATKNNDDALRVKVAEEWARLYDAPVKPGTGCLSSGIKTYYCQMFRKCATKKAIDTCADCSDYR